MRKTAHSGTVTCGTCHGEEFVIKLEREKTVLVCTSCGCDFRLTPEVRSDNLEGPVTAASQGVDLEMT
jgi:transcription elongation factor Elf1